MSLEQAILDVLADTNRLIARNELARVDRIRGVRRDPSAVAAVVNTLLERGLIVEPEGKGQGVEITDEGRRRLAAISVKMTGIRDQTL